MLNVCHWFHLRMHITVCAGFLLTHQNVMQCANVLWVILIGSLAEEILSKLQVIYESIMVVEALLLIPLKSYNCIMQNFSSLIRM